MVTVLADMSVGSASNMAVASARDQESRFKLFKELHPFFPCFANAMSKSA
jgi:hypothetical protein